jgi:hypothetical protein
MRVRAHARVMRVGACAHAVCARSCILCVCLFVCVDECDSDGTRHEHEARVCIMRLMLCS